MVVYDLFSKRQKRSRGELVDVFQYDDIPQKLRVQVVHIIRNAFGKDKHVVGTVDALYQHINDILCKEYGVFFLSNQYAKPDIDTMDYLLNCNNFEHALDIIEICFLYIDEYVRKRDYRSRTECWCTPDEAIEELNIRFRENTIGYEYQSGKIIRVDSQVMHSEVVVPVLTLLSSEERFKTVNQEYLNSHEHYRHSRYKECLIDANCAFESVMKIICNKHGWDYKETDTASSLINTCERNGLIPNYLSKQLLQMIPITRNKKGGHGQGTEEIVVEESYASYVLHLVASTILFLVKRESEI